tara:strand:+ start:273 stop:701 length:429 start_codon:yes stop_codon:yes gene_type:complete
MIKLFVILNIFLLFISCSNQTIYSGKILNQEDLSNLNFKNKDILVKKIGKPSFVDPIDNKFFYFSEKRKKKSVFKEEIVFSFVFVFEFNEKNKIINSKVYDLKNTKNFKFINEETDNEIVKRGLIERIFGGVGPNQELPNSP